MKIVSLGLLSGVSCSTRSFKPRTMLLGVPLHVGIAFTCLFTVFRAWAADCAPPPDGLVAWWPGEGDGNDIAGPNNGTLVNGATFELGKARVAFSLDGTNDVVEVPSSPALSFGANEAMTVELWAYRTTAKPVAHILGKRVGTSTTMINYQMAWDVSGRLSFGAAVGNRVETGIDLPLNTWTHLAGTFGGGTYEFYINGQLAASASGLTLGPTNDAPLRIGGSGQDTFTTFGGLLDEVSVYSRVLSAAEIQAIYNAGSAGKCLPPSACTPPPAGLVAWWPGEGDANEIGHSNDGVLEGSVAFSDGLVGQAFSFNGTDANLRVPASSSLNLGLADGFTIETWINPADITQPHPILEWNDGSFGVCFWVSQCALPVSAGSLLIDVKDTSLHDHCFSTAPGLLLSNTWQHVAATYVRSNGYTVLYVNGVPMAQATLGAFIPRTIGDVYVALRPYDGGAGSRFAGLIDEISLYNRALSPSEIAAIYNAGSAGKCGLPPTIVTPPQSQMAVVGMNASFSVVAEGSPPLSYQWQSNGTDIGGATDALLTLTNVQLAEAGSYTVQVTSPYGSVTSAGAVLTVVSSVPPPPTNGLVAYFPFNGNATDASGSGMDGVVYGATLTADRFGTPNSAYSFNGTSAYIRTDKTLADMQSASASFWISVSAFPGYGSYVFMDGDSTPARDFFVAVGSGTDLWLATKDNQWIRGDLPPLANTWFHVVAVADNSSANVLKLWLNGRLLGTSPSLGNANVGDHSQLHIGCRGTYHDYFFKGAMDDLRYYNRPLSDSEVQQLYLHESSTCPAPFITAQPRNQVGYWGKSVTFTLAAEGVPPLSYQWHKESMLISGATGSSLVLTNLQMTDAGNYSVVVTNQCGSTASSSACLTMNPSGVSLALYPGVTIDGVVGLTYGIQYTTDLDNTNSWQGLANVTLSVPRMLWFDVYPATLPVRYYRVLPGPIPIP